MLIFSLADTATVIGLTFQFEESNMLSVERYPSASGSVQRATSIPALSETIPPENFTSTGITFPCIVIVPDTPSGENRRSSIPGPCSAARWRVHPVCASMSTVSVPAPIPPVVTSTTRQNFFPFALAAVIDRVVVMTIFCPPIEKLVVYVCVDAEILDGLRTARGAGDSACAVSGAFNDFTSTVRTSSLFCTSGATLSW